MNASKIEFRMRGLILTLIVVLGFWAPWIQALDLGKRISTLEWLALQISRVGLLRFTYATPVVIVCGAILSAIGMVLRITGAAFLGNGVVHNGRLQNSALITAGPYRYVRNPLYLGGLCMITAISLVMPPTGALSTIILVALFYLRLMLVEESFLTATLGEPYREYFRTVPRFFPRLRSPLPRGTVQPHWLTAASAEVMSIGTFVTLAVLAWTYDNLLMTKAMIISFGLSLVSRAIFGGKTNPVPGGSDSA